MNDDQQNMNPFITTQLCNEVMQKQRAFHCDQYAAEVLI